MTKKSGYQTKQLSAIRSVCKSFGDSYFTASDVLLTLEKHNIQLGLTTVYRQLKRLEEEAFISSAKLSGSNKVSYRYIPESENHTYYMQCEDCGKIIHFPCRELNSICQHLADEHNFSINPHKTVFYGSCGCKED